VVLEELVADAKEQAGAHSPVSAVWLQADGRE